MHLAVLVGVVALVSGLLSGGARSAHDDSQLIAFTRADGIYVIRADGRAVRALHRGGVAAGALDLAWSPDGRLLAFTTREGEIWTMNANGKDLVRVVAADQISARAYGPLSWTPRGRRIAFTAYRVGERPDIWVVNANGTNAHRLLRTPARFEFHVDWSPDGRRIAFTTPIGWFMRLYVMNTDGTHVRAINPGAMFQAAMPHWSPQGQRIAFMAWPDWGSVRDAEIRVAGADGRARQLTHNSVTDSNPAWSPDGARIVFLRGRDADMLFVSPERRSPGEIYVMNADGTGATRLTYNGLGEGSPAWQPVPAP